MRPAGIEPIPARRDMANRKAATTS
jgi:hypothetical protein